MFDRATVVCLVGALLVPSLGGCLSQDTVNPVPRVAPGAIQVPVPQTNSTYAYEARDGATLNVTIGEKALRVDAWLREHEVLRIAYVHWNGNEEDDRFRFEEAVGSSGRLVQQYARCGGWRGDRKHCLDERGTVVTAAQGLPGGFGAAPWWGETVEPGRSNLSLRTPAPPLPNITYTVSEPTVSDVPCLEFRPESGPDRTPRAFRYTGGLDAFTLCEDAALPTSFTSLGGRTYQLVRSDRSGQPVDLDTSGGGTTTKGPPVDRIERSTPLVVEHEAVETRFPVREAHEVALDRSDAYASLFEGDALLTSTHFDWKSRHREPLGTWSSRTVQRTLEALASDGQGVGLQIRKTISKGPMGNRTSYEMVEEWTGSTDDPPTATTLVRRQASLQEAIALGERLTGQEVDRSTGFGLWNEIPTPPWQLIDHPPVRSDGYTVVLWHEDPTPQTSGGLVIHTPYQTVVDGPTGTLLWVTTNRSRFPIAS